MDVRNLQRLEVEVTAAVDEKELTSYAARTSYAKELTSYAAARTSYAKELTSYAAARTSYAK